MEFYQVILYVVVFFAVIIAIFISTGGKSLFGTHEKFEKIIGKTIQFSKIECAPNGLLLKSKAFPIGEVIRCVDSIYHLKFLEPFELNGKMEAYARIKARYIGHPISNINKFNNITVIGNFESGAEFIAEIKLERKNRTTSSNESK